MPIFDTFAFAEAYAPDQAPESIETLGYDVVGVGGGLYISNGTTVGDLVITLLDGTTEVGYTLTRNVPYDPHQVAVIGYVDDRSAFQEMLDKIQPGDTLYFPGWAKAKIVNGIGTGADAWARRADAVANGGLLALTCNKSDVSLVIDGVITVTEPLDDGFRMTGDRVRVSGKGMIEYTGGTFIDTNAQSDITKQWLPSLLSLMGADSGCDGGGSLRFRRPPSVGIKLGGVRCYAVENRIFGGPIVYQPNGNSNGDFRDNGTVNFGVYSGAPGSSPANQRVEGNWFFPDTDGGKPYDGVFNTSQNAIIRGNNHSGAWEHAVYSYGIRTLIEAEMISGTVFGAIQAFNEGAVVKNCEIEHCGGGVQFMRAYYTQALGNKITRTQGSGIAYRSYPGEDNDLLYIDNIIAGNTISLDPTQWGSGIDIYLENPFIGLEIANNIISGAGTGENAGIYVGVDAIASTAGSTANIHDNIVRNTDGVGISFDRITNFKIRNNQIMYPNGALSGGGSAAIYGANCSKGEVTDNVVIDGRASRKTDCIASFSAANSNSAITGTSNGIVGALDSSSAPVIIPLSDASWVEGNSFDWLAPEGAVTLTGGSSFKIGQTSFPVNAEIASAIAASIKPGAKVDIFPGRGDAAALALQISAAAMYVSDIGKGYFTIASSNGTTVGSGITIGFRITM